MANATKQNWTRPKGQNGNVNKIDIILKQDLMKSSELQQIQIEVSFKSFSKSSSYG